MKKNSEWWLLCVKNKNNLKNWYFNEIKFRIDDMMWVFFVKWLCKIENVDFYAKINKKNCMSGFECSN